MRSHLAHLIRQECLIGLQSRCRGAICSKMPTRGLRTDAVAEILPIQHVFGLLLLLLLQLKLHLQLEPVLRVVILRLCRRNSRNSPLECPLVSPLAQLCRVVSPLVIVTVANAEIVLVQTTLLQLLLWLRRHLWLCSRNESVRNLVSAECLHCPVDV